MSSSPLNSAGGFSVGSSRTLVIDSNANIAGNHLSVDSANLGSAANLTITGGTNGQTLITDGTGNLSWTTVVNGGAVQATDYITVRRSSSDQYVASGDTLIWNSVATSSGISYNTSTGVFTLTAGKTYILSLSPSFTSWSSSGAYFYIQWVDASSGSALVEGVNVFADYLGRTPNSDAKNNTIVYTPTTNQTIKVVTTGSGASYMQSGLSVATIYELASITGPSNVGNLTAGNLTVTNKSNLGAVGNVTITGGSSGQSLTTDGAGNLSWSTIGYGTSEYLYASILNTPTISADTDIVASTILSYSGSLGSTYNTSTGIFTLKSGVTYRLTASIGTINWSSTGYGYIDIAWVNANTNVILANTNNMMLLPYTNYYNQTQDNTIIAYYTPTSDMSVKLRVMGGSGTVQIRDINSGILVEQVGSTSLSGNVNLGGGGTSNITGSLSVSANLAVTGKSNLGNIGNITITGGSAGQVLSTDGTGNLSWANGGSGGNSANANYANFAGEAYAVSGSNVSGIVANANIANKALALDSAIANVKITGGSSGQSLTTDGAGNLSWSTISAGYTSYNYSKITTSSVGTGAGDLAVSTQNYSGSLTNDGVNFQLQANKTYLLVAMIGWSENSAAYAFFQWVDSASNVRLSGTQEGCAIHANFNSGAVEGSDIAATGIYTPTTNQTVKVRYIAGSGGGLATNQSYAYIIELSSSSLSGNITVGGGGTSNINGSLGISSNLTVVGKSNLGAVANVFITGGSNGQALITDGAGNLTWGNVASGNAANANYANYAGNVTESAQANITSLGNLTGLTVIGNVSATGNTNANSTTQLKFNILGSLANPTLQLGNANASFTPTIDTGVLAVGNFTGTYSGITIQNRSSSSTSSTNFYLSADDATETTNYVAYGINSSNYDGGQLMDTGPYSTYLTSTHGDIIFAPQALRGMGNANSTGGNIHFAYDYINDDTYISKGITITNKGALSVDTVANAGGYTFSTGTAGQVLVSNGPNSAISWSNTAPQATTAGTVTTNAQPNITSVGTLSNLTVGGTSNLGAVGNVTITGGSNGQVLTTNGNGALSWSNVSGGSGNSVTVASGFVNAGVDVTLGNLKARLAGSGNRSLMVSTVSGTYSLTGSGYYVVGGSMGSLAINSGSPVSVTTTPTYIASGYNFAMDGDTNVWTLMDNSAGVAWRITLIIGAFYINNFISIERLL